MPIAVVFIGVILLLTIVFAAVKLGGWSIALFAVIFVTVMASYFVSMQHSVEVAQVDESLSNEVYPADGSPLSTEEMWEHLSRPRIQLSEEQQPTVPTDSETDGEQPATDEPTKPYRPSWVDTPPTRVGNVYREVVSSGPYSTVEESHLALNPIIRQVVHLRIAQLVPDANVPPLEKMGLGLDYVLREICRQEWVETDQRSFGDMKQVHVLMEFDKPVDEHLSESYRSYLRTFRIAEVSSIVAFVLGGLALLYGMLKIDTWTRGYYTKRLFFGVPAVIMLVLLFLSD